MRVCALFFCRFEDSEKMFARIKLERTKSMEIIDKCLESKFTIIGSRPVQGKMQFLAKLIKKMIERKNRVTLFALEGSENWYLCYILSEISGIDKKIVHRYLYPCVFTGKEKGLLIDRNKYVEGIEYLQNSHFYIKNYNWICPSNINTLNILEIVIEEIKNVFDDVDWIIIDRLDDLVNSSDKSRKEVLKILDDELKLSNISLIVFDTLKKSFYKNKGINTKSFVDYKEIDKYSDRIILIHDYEDYLIK